ncbi:hypothetical protein SprV_0802463700 [Sparganum proliferum]
MDIRTASSAAASARTHGEQKMESRQHSGTLYQSVSEATERIAGELGVDIAHRRTATMRNKIMRVKDRLDIDDQSGVVYQIPCRDCPRHCTGQTGRRLSSQITEQKRAVRRSDPSYQVATQTLEEDHKFNFASARIVERASNKTGRELLEACASHTNCINRHVDIPPAITRSVPAARRPNPISSQGCMQSRRRETAWDSAYREYHPLHSFDAAFSVSDAGLLYETKSSD